MGYAREQYPSWSEPVYNIPLNGVSLVTSESPCYWEASIADASAFKYTGETPLGTYYAESSCDVTEPGESTKSYWGLVVS